LKKSVRHRHKKGNSSKSDLVNASAQKTNEKQSQMVMRGLKNGPFFEKKQFAIVVE
jgi:hypothetical protein